MKKVIKISYQFLKIGILVAIVYFAYNWWFSVKKEKRFSLENTPLILEQINEISEIATVSYNNEIVVDSVEYYSNSSEQISGNIQKIFNDNDFKYGISGSAIKRKITLISAGEVRVGFDFHKKNIQIKRDTVLHLMIPKPVVLDVLMNPSQGRIFEENGVWSDYEVRFIKQNAMKNLIKTADINMLNRQAELNFKNLIYKLYPKEKSIKIDFL